MYKKYKLGVSDDKYKVIIIKKETDLYHTNDYVDPEPVKYGAYHENGDVFNFYSYLKATNLVYLDAAETLDAGQVELVGPDLLLGFYSDEALDTFEKDLDYWGVLA